jgi:hypothetical protein
VLQLTAAAPVDDVVPAWRRHTIGRRFDNGLQRSSREALDRVDPDESDITRSSAWNEDHQPSASAYSVATGRDRVHA